MTPVDDLSARHLAGASVIAWRLRLIHGMTRGGRRGLPPRWGDPRRRVVAVPESAGMVGRYAGRSTFLAGEQTSFVRIGCVAGSFAARVLGIRCFLRFLSAQKPYRCRISAHADRIHQAVQRGA